MSVTTTEAQQQTSPAMQQLMDLLAKQEPLDPDLQLYVSNAPGLGPCLQHPLVYMMLLTPQQYAMCNHMLRQKREALAEAEAKGQWHSYVYLHEKPWRINAFITVSRRMSDEDYWRLLGSIWVDSENIRQNRLVWESLLTDATRDLSKRHMLMVGEEQAALALLPDTFTVYRGYDKRHLKQAREGMSWTTSCKTAQWFSTRLLPAGGSGVVLERTVHKRDVIAHFTGRKEDEVVLLPAKAGEVKVFGTFKPAPGTRPA